ncbi:MAG: helix-turn-helix domain-containing protein [Planctomycetota bacterium]
MSADLRFNVGSPAPVPDSSVVVVTASPVAVSIDTAARMLGLSPRFVAGLVGRGDLASFKAGARRLIAVTTIEAWVVEQLAAAADDRGDQ